jgi:guanylate kinase
MRLHLKSRFQMLRHKRLNEVIATDTYFANENQLKAIIARKYFLE